MIIMMMMIFFTLLLFIVIIKKNRYMTAELFLTMIILPTINTN